MSVDLMSDLRNLPRREGAGLAALGRGLGLLALASVLGACVPSEVTAPGAVTMVEWQGASYPLRIVPMDRFPVYSVGPDGREADPPLMAEQATVRVAAKDKLTAAAVFEWHCRGNASIDRGAWADEMVPFDKTTGEWIIGGTCS